MRECPQCRNAYAESFLYCPADGSQLGENKEEPEQPAGAKARPDPGQNLAIGIAILVLSAVVAFAGLFFYQYWKPKYGNLVVKTTPPGAMIWLDGKLRGASPITLRDLRNGGHYLKGTKDGYKEFFQQVVVMPYATENLHWNMEPIVPQLTNEQLAEVESWKKRLEGALKENILLPPPDDYNVLYFADKILSIDPADAEALEAKAKLAETVRRLAESAYAREDWLESEKQYKNLALLFPNDINIGERLADVASKLDESLKNREQQIQDWTAKADAALKVGSLLPPDKDNALDAIRSIQRLDKNNAYARQAIAQLKELQQNRGDTKIAASDWTGARNDFKLLLQYFPEDSYSKSQLAVIEEKIGELKQVEQQRVQRTAEEQQSKQKTSALRQSALSSFRAGLYQKSISEWQDYLKFEPDSDEAYFYIGASYQDLKQLDTAILNFEKCLSLNSNNVLAHLNLGLLYDYHRDSFKQAEEHLRKAKELGGAEKYSPERLQSMIQDLRDRAQASSIIKQPLAVEHRHSFSSCKGNILFTEEGFEYRTSETDHSFYESFKGLRGFAVEGDELSLKTRNNKRYNFRFLNPGDAARIRTWSLSSRYIRLSGQVE
jgi:tetratricopeptide (TPR) repeat protein